MKAHRILAHVGAFLHATSVVVSTLARELRHAHERAWLSSVMADLDVSDITDPDQLAGEPSKQAGVDSDDQPEAAVTAEYPEARQPGDSRSDAHRGAAVDVERSPGIAPTLLLVTAKRARRIGVLN